MDVGHAMLRRRMMTNFGLDARGVLQPENRSSEPERRSNGLVKGPSANIGKWLELELDLETRLRVAA